ncbi:hypothetical protein QBC34DRAFT_475973, partial [Podospora aff. communis PSN243]
PDNRLQHHLLRLSPHLHRLTRGRRVIPSPTVYHIPQRARLRDPHRFVFYQRAALVPNHRRRPSTKLNTTPPSAHPPPITHIPQTATNSPLIRLQKAMPILLNMNDILLPIIPPLRPDDVRVHHLVQHLPARMPYPQAQLARQHGLAGYRGVGRGVVDGQRDVGLVLFRGRVAAGPEARDGGVAVGFGEVGVVLAVGEGDGEEEFGGGGGV